jgi:hypothetical protein
MRPAPPPSDQDISLSELKIITRTRNLCKTVTSVLDRLFLLRAKGMKYQLSGRNVNGQGTTFNQRLYVSTLTLYILRQKYLN